VSLRVHANREPWGVRSHRKLAGDSLTVNRHGGDRGGFGRILKVRNVNERTLHIANGRTLQMPNLSVSTGQVSKKSFTENDQWGRARTPEPPREENLKYGVTLVLLRSKTFVKSHKTWAKMPWWLNTENNLVAAVDGIYHLWRSCFYSVAMKSLPSVKTVALWRISWRLYREANRDNDLGVLLLNKTFSKWERISDMILW